MYTYSNMIDKTRFLCAYLPLRIVERVHSRVVSSIPINILHLMSCESMMWRQVYVTKTIQRACLTSVIACQGTSWYHWIIGMCVSLWLFEHLNFHRRGVRWSAILTFLFAVGRCKKLQCKHLSKIVDQHHVILTCPIHGLMAMNSSPSTSSFLNTRPPCPTA